MDIYNAFIWFICNIISIAFLAFYSMMEMACVSFNKVRLQYYVSRGIKRSIWLNYLLQHPSRLFGTTLIAVNIALVIGSECSREFYASLGLSPDISPLTQVFLVVIFGELAPMFAARRYAEHVAMLGIPFVYFTARLMTPFLWIVGLVSKACNLIIGGDEDQANKYLNQEELQKILEEQSEEPYSEIESTEFSAIAANIFSLRGKDARLVMEPLNTVPILPANATVAQLEELLNKTEADYVPLYNREISNIMGIVYVRDVLRANDTRRVRDDARPPWFVSETTTVIQILKQFRINNENVAIVINQSGKAIGLVKLTSVLNEIFGKVSSVPGILAQKEKKLMIIDKTFPGDMTVADFNAQYGVLLDEDPKLTLADLIEKHLGHHPEKGESIYIPPVEITVKDTSLLEIKTVTVSTRL